MSEAEKVINTWTVVYSTQSGHRFTGKLTITNKRLLYDANFTSVNREKLEESLFVKWGSDDFIVIPKTRIRKVEVLKKIFSNRAIITLDDDSQHVFNYGMLNIEPISRAIHQS